MQVRYFLVFAFCASTFAQSPLVKILSDELNRNFTALKQKGEPPPYFMAYAVTDDETDVVVASEGSLDAQNHGRHRILDVTLRAGSPQFDNYRRVGAERPRFTSGTSIALDDNPVSIRQTLWLATDRVYRAASNRLVRIKADEKLRAAADDTSDDFSKEDPQTFFGPTPQYKFDAADWAKRLRKLSGEFTKYPGALNATVAVEAQRIAKTFVNTDGTRLEHGRLFARLVITARGKAPDGMDLATMETFEADDPAKLPKDAQILTAVERAGANLTSLLRAPPSDPFVGRRFFRGARPGFFSTRYSAIVWRDIARRTNPRARRSRRASANQCSRSFCQ